MMEESKRVLIVGQMLGENGYMPLADQRTLDIGSGSGKVLASLVQWGALPKNPFGPGLIPEQIEAAKQRFQGIQFTQGNAEHLDFEEKFFALVLLFTVFTSILDKFLIYWKERYPSQPGQFAVAHSYFAGAVKLPLFPGITDAEVERVASVLREVLE